MPRLLAVDTATERLAVAVVAGDRSWAADEEGGPRASSRVLPLARELLDQAGFTLRELDAVAFGRGPGAFTGLRTACSVAQGLALGIGCPLLPLDSLALVAEAAQARHGAVTHSIWVAMDARMDEVYAGAYCRADGGWQVVQAPALWTLPALAAAWAVAPPLAITGTALAAFGERLPRHGAACLDAGTQRAPALARLARQMWRCGAAVDPVRALPLYLRDKVALTTAERLAARTAATA